MTLLVLLHILGGTLGLLSGFVALQAAKGARLHRRSGILFVYSMLTMALLGAGMAALAMHWIDVVAGLLAAYLVTTALTTVRPPTAGARRLDRAAMLFALGLGLASVGIGFAALAGASVTSDDVPAPVPFVFGGVALLGGLSDLRVLRSGPLVGARRLARHLWRMCFALFIASASFFLGQADEIPEPLRIPLLLAVPVLVPLLAMAAWLWRLRRRRPARGLPFVAGAPQGERA